MSAALRGQNIVFAADHVYAAAHTRQHWRNRLRGEPLMARAALTYPPPSPTALRRRVVTASSSPGEPPAGPRCRCAVQWQRSKIVLDGFDALLEETGRRCARRCWKWRRRSPAHKRSMVRRRPEHDRPAERIADADGRTRHGLHEAREISPQLGELPSPLPSVVSPCPRRS